MKISKYKVKDVWYKDDLGSKLAHHSPFLQKILMGRGIQDAESAKMYLDPDYDRDTHDPFLMKDMERAVDRIISAIENDQKIVIYSDYDTDGIPGAVVMHDTFKKIGYKNVSVYIPHRHDEGFGFHEDAVNGFGEKGVNLIITIDCGITNVDAVKTANKNGIDVIITDHHLPGDVVPPAYAIVNPKQEGCLYPEKMLCGSGVIYKLIQALMKEGAKKDLWSVKEGWEKWLLDMVGLATLSDMVPLLGENRVFAKYGLFVMKKSPRIGFNKLLEQGGIRSHNILEDDIGFTISPRINAASRMGVPYDAFRLLSTDDETEANEVAKNLDKINKERKGIVGSMVKEIKKHISEREIGPVIVAGNPEWKPSLLGLVANSCAEEYKRPIFVWGRDGDGVIKGSCRSAELFDLVELMKAVPADTFIQFGGHAFSGGFSVSNEKIFDLETRLIDAYKKISENIDQVSGDMYESIDGELSIDDVSWDLYDDLAKCAPFGVGNPKPIFIFHDAIPQTVAMFGKEGNHLKITYKGMSAPKGIINAIAFFKTDKDFDVAPKAGVPHTLVGHIEKSLWLGRPELRIRIVDII